MSLIIRYYKTIDRTIEILSVIKPYTNSNITFSFFVKVIKTVLIYKVLYVLYKKSVIVTISIKNILFEYTVMRLISRASSRMKIAQSVIDRESKRRSVVS